MLWRRLYGLFVSMLGSIVVAKGWKGMIIVTLKKCELGLDTL